MTASYRPGIYCALDTAELDAAQSLARKIKPSVAGLKLGLEFFLSQGQAGFRAIAEEGLPLFLDLKLHDIPNTVAGALAAILPLEPALITLHASGGRAMMEKAAETAVRLSQSSGTARPKLVAVTVLTSLDDTDLADMNVSVPPLEQAGHLAQLAKDCGMDGIVCSAREIVAIRTALGEGFITVVPGLRPAGDAPSDQKRVTTPEEAKQRGATVMVIGRAITAADDPATAAASIAEGVKRC